MTFIEDQAKKEVAAGKKVWASILWLLVIWWGIQGLTMLATSAWLVGLVFLGAAAFVYSRIKGKQE